MICDSCRRDVGDVKASFWHGDAMICRECFAKWCDPDNVIGAGDAASVGNYVRLQHGLPPLAAALAVLLLAGTTMAQASRHCLDQAEAARTWPTQRLVKDGDGCWTYNHHPAREEVPRVPEKTLAPMREATLSDRWVDVDMLRLDLSELEPKRISEPPSPPGPFESAKQFALFVALVLAVASVVEVATARHAGKNPGPRPRWPDRKAPAGWWSGFDIRYPPGRKFRMRMSNPRLH
jgi:hypothetical protein